MKKLESLTSARQWLEDVRDAATVGVADRVKDVLQGTKQYAFREVNIRNYLGGSGDKKLQIGTGENFLEGWLNTDLSPTDKRVAYINATKRFPFPDDSFDAIFSEHMIEHIAYEEGCHMLRECFRILKPGGELRIVTPDIRALFHLYDEPRKPVQDHYIKWMTDRFWPSVGRYDPVFIVNLAMRFSGHQFFYDEETMLRVIEEAGFPDVEKVHPGHSARSVFDGVDSHARFIESEEVNEYEAMAFEAVKPPR